MLNESGKIIIEALVASVILMVGILGITKGVAVSLNYLNDSLRILKDQIHSLPHEVNTSCTQINIPNIGKNVPDSMCDLGDIIRNIFKHIPDTD